jgi:AbiV family abortive infection protein
MRTRAIKDLARLNDKDLFVEVAEGMSAVRENASSVAEAFKILAERRSVRGARILEAIAKEEAAKYLIFLDVVRCPRMPTDRFSRQLEKYNEHLAKGLYAEACEWRPADFGEIKSYIADGSQEYYLDGPNGTEWIFQNSIIRQREEAFYVDYIEGDHTHIWLSPAWYDSPSSISSFVPSVVKLVNQLHTVGFSKPQSLELISSIWRPIGFTDRTHSWDLGNLNHKTLKGMCDAGLLNELDDKIYRDIVDVWPFPLYDVEMRQIPVKQSKLRELQDRWYPE